MNRFGKWEAERRRKKRVELEAQGVDTSKMADEDIFCCSRKMTEEEWHEAVAAYEPQWHRPANELAFRKCPEKFRDRSIDSGTVIEDIRHVKSDLYEFIVENWSWEGVRGHSAVFLEEQLSGMSDDDLIKLFFTLLKLPDTTKTTMGRTDGRYAFVNFFIDEEVS